MTAEGAQPKIEFGGSGHGEVLMGTCPDCGSQLEFAKGRVKCHVCVVCTPNPDPSGVIKRG